MEYVTLWSNQIKTPITALQLLANDTDEEIRIEILNRLFEIEQYQEYDNNYPITLDAAEDVYNEVLSDAGATLPKRDEVDTRIIGEVETRTAPIGSKGSVGLVDDPTDCIPEGATNYDGRGYPRSRRRLELVIMTLTASHRSLFYMNFFRILRSS